MRIAIAGDEILRYVEWLRAIAALPGALKSRLHFGANACQAALADAGDTPTHCLLACGETLDALPAALAALRAANPELRVVALIDATRIAQVDALIDAGVTAAFAIDAPFTADQRLGVLRMALSGVRLVDPGLLSIRSGPSAATGDAGAPPSFPALSRRQREIVSLIAGGASNKQIARALSLSETTIKSHLTTTMRRLGLSSRLQLAIAATRGGMSIG